ncbi:hypothetical protein ONK29_25605, partial [Salmonella enterica subsp. enterica serovar Anatum]|nr:hypothetical protein [Salmonella enterica subsp. enterica serovar Anatum]
LRPQVDAHGVEPGDPGAERHQRIHRRRAVQQAFPRVTVKVTALSADRTRCDITGNGGALRAPGALELFLGNAGTAMRPLAAALC